MNSAWGLLPLAMDESDIMMLVLALFVLSIFIVAMFIALPLAFAVLGTLLIILAILYGVRELRKKESKE